MSAVPPENIRTGGNSERGQRDELFFRVDEALCKAFKYGSQFLVIFLAERAGLTDRLHDGNSVRILVQAPVQLLLILSDIRDFDVFEDTVDRCVQDRDLVLDFPRHVFALLENFHDAFAP